MAALRIVSALLVLVIGGQAVLANTDVYNKYSSALEFLDKISENGADQNRRLDWAVSIMGLSSILKKDSSLTLLANSLEKAVEEDIISKKDAENLIVDSSNDKDFYLDIDQSPRDVLKEAIEIALKKESVPQKELEQLKQWGAKLDDKPRDHSSSTSAEESKEMAREIKSKAGHFEFLHRGLNEKKIPGYEIAALLFVAGQKYANGQESIVTPLVGALDEATKDKVISPDVAYTLLRVLVADEELIRKANVRRAEAVKKLVKSALRGHKVSKADAKKLKKWASKSGSKKSNSSSSSSSEEN